MGNNFPLIEFKVEQVICSSEYCIRDENLRGNTIVVSYMTKSNVIFQLLNSSEITAISPL